MNLPQHVEDGHGDGAGDHVAGVLVLGHVREARDHHVDVLGAGAHQEPVLYPPDAGKFRKKCIRVDSNLELLTYGLQIMNKFTLRNQDKIIVSI